MMMYDGDNFEQFKRSDGIAVNEISNAQDNDYYEFLFFKKLCREVYQEYKNHKQYTADIKVELKNREGKIAPSITEPPSSLTEGRRYVTDGGRLAQRPHQGASGRLR
jgi:hypothetical protein